MYRDCIVLGTNVGKITQLERTGTERRNGGLLLHYNYDVLDYCTAVRRALEVCCLNAPKITKEQKIRKLLV